MGQTFLSDSCSPANGEQTRVAKRALRFSKQKYSLELGSAPQSSMEKLRIEFA